MLTGSKAYWILLMSAGGRSTGLCGGSSWEQLKRIGLRYLIVSYCLKKVKAAERDVRTWDGRRDRIGCLRSIVVAMITCGEGDLILRNTLNQIALVSLEGHALKNSDLLSFSLLFSLSFCR